jgi:hypothetical protein
MNFYSKKATDNFVEKCSNRFRNATGNGFNNAAGSLSLINSNARALTIRITLISSTAAGTAEVFGYNIYPDETTNTANNVTVTITQSSHLRVKRMSENQPFRVKGLKMSVTTAAQFSNPMRIFRSTPLGHNEDLMWNPNDYTDPDNQQTLLIYDRDFQCPIDAYTYWQLAVDAGETIILTTYLDNQVDPSNVLDNKSVIKVSDKPLPTGKSPVVLQSTATAQNFGYGKK